MKKGFYTVCLALFFMACSLNFVFAAKDMPRLVDEAGLLSPKEEEKLLGLLDEISERQQADLVVVTENSLDGKTPMDFADDFYDNNGYGFGPDKDGILFLISMEERDWYISTSGFGITAVTDAGIQYMSEKFLGALGDGEYARAFTDFAKLCDDFLTQAHTGSPYDTGNLPKEPFHAARSLAISAAIGFLAALLITEVMRGKLKTVRSQPAADSYVKRGSMELLSRSDLFLYRQLARRAKPKENSGSGHSSGGSSTHRSSSGRTHGGGGGKF